MSFTIFLLGVFAFIAFQMWLRDRKRRDLIDLAKQTVAAGQELPPELWSRLLEPDPERSQPGWLVPALFTLLTIGFGVVAAMMPVENGQRAFGVVAAVMAAVALTTAFAEIMRRRDGR